MRLLLAAGLILLPAYMASAQPPSDDGKQQESKKICKVDPEDTDSRVRRRICKTEADWNEKTGNPDRETERSPKQGQ